MGSVFGNNIKVSIYGESHGPMIGAVIDGLPSGFKIDVDNVNHYLTLRQPRGDISTSRTEEDEIEYISGVFNGYTTGAPLHIAIANKNIKSKDYNAEEIRPSHTDLVAYYKYHGYQDYRGSGHFSGRISAIIVVVGSIIRQLLKSKGIIIGSHIQQIKDVKDTKFSSNNDELNRQVNEMNSKYFAVLDNVEGHMKIAIEKARTNQDSVGGIIETAIVNMPKGIGEPFFNSLESTISQLLFSVPAVKGIEFGLGFDFVDKYGSEANDQMEINNEVIEYLSNNNGGINGGISNGQPIIFSSVIKPTPSIAKCQKSINYKTKENINLAVSGRHDPCIVHRARVVIDSIVALGLIDLLMQEYGRSYFYEN